jgi:hypothetical protein
LRGRLRVLLGLGGLGTAAGILESEFLEGSDVGSLLDKDSDGLYRSKKYA